MYVKMIGKILGNIMLTGLISAAGAFVMQVVKDHTKETVKGIVMGFNSIKNGMK